MAPLREIATPSEVVDGDTLRLEDGRRVRLVQIDAPEQASECHGEAARRALERLVAPGTRIELERDPALDDVDEHGRLLRYVLVDGVNVNLRLVELGAAAPYFFRGERGRHADRMLELARRARGQARGLWGDCPGARLEPALGALTGPA